MPYIYLNLKYYALNNQHMKIFWCSTHHSKARTPSRQIQISPIFFINYYPNHIPTVDPLQQLNHSGFVLTMSSHNGHILTSMNVPVSLRKMLNCNIKIHKIFRHLKLRIFNYNCLSFKISFIGKIIKTCIPDVRYLPWHSKFWYFGKAKTDNNTHWKKRSFYSCSLTV